MAEWATSASPEEAAQYLEEARLHLGAAAVGLGIALEAGHPFPAHLVAAREAVEMAWQAIQAAQKAAASASAAAREVAPAADPC